MGRRKVIKKMEPDEQKSVQFGRNMLIEKYLWIYYVQSLPPGVKPDESMRRDRKKIMSHIQVEKDFFKHHPTCKFQTASAPTATKDRPASHPCPVLILPVNNCIVLLLQSVNLHLARIECLRGGLVAWWLGGFCNGLLPSLARQCLQTCANPADLG